MFYFFPAGYRLGSLIITRFLPPSDSTSLRFHLRLHLRFRLGVSRLRLGSLLLLLVLLVLLLLLSSSPFPLLDQSQQLLPPFFLPSADASLSPVSSH